VVGDNLYKWRTRLVAVDAPPLATKMAEFPQVSTYSRSSRTSYVISDDDSV
jgi:hypothetical protein